jgi:pyruvate,water dikinase
MKLLADFSDIDSTMINAVGGKALNLGVMSSAGLPVPGGFCVTTDAYRLVVADRLDDLMGKLADATDPGGVAGAAEEARHSSAGRRAPRRASQGDHRALFRARPGGAGRRTIIGNR